MTKGYFCNERVLYTIFSTQFSVSTPHYFNVVPIPKVSVQSLNDSCKAPTGQVEQLQTSLHIAAQRALCRQRTSDIIAYSQ